MIAVKDWSFRRAVIIGTARKSKWMMGDYAAAAANYRV
jgi:hypothetical protein